MKALTGFKSFRQGKKGENVSAYKYEPGAGEAGQEPGAGEAGQEPGAGEAGQEPGAGEAKKHNKV